MMNIGDIELEYRSGALFGIVALLLSLTAGIAAGNGAGQVVGRSLVLMLVFAALGYIAIYVFRKYVPEVYEVLKAMPGLRVSEEGLKELPDEDRPATTDGISAEEATPDSGTEAETASGVTPARTDAFVPLQESDFTAYSSARPEQGKLGKHFFEQKNIRYEPKIMAEAIRTMIARDKE
ncbi:MAG: hypothetical protein MUC76_06055 [Spirochaetes bacterium]|jgi:hypothetical protein|nr:hypothetical protein [Spirochaetota bacterium]